jgi:hypothetical protein
MASSHDPLQQPVSLWKVLIIIATLIIVLVILVWIDLPGMIFGNTLYRYPRFNTWLTGKTSC